jgi:hypothetical protein
VSCVNMLDAQFSSGDPKDDGRDDVDWIARGLERDA